MKISSIALPILVVALLIACNNACAQFPVQYLPATTDNWNAPENWEDIGAGQNVPTSEFDEVGVIDSGGTAQVLDTPVSPGGVTINDGTVEILETGALFVVPGLGNQAQGVVEINANGTLSVAPGGFLSAQSFTSGGTLRVRGSTATLNVTDEMTFEDGGTYVAEILSASHSTISVFGNTNLGGTLVADFTGHVPAAGQFWDLVTAPTIGGSFSAVDTIGLGPLPLGQALTVRTTTGGSQGTVARLAVENQLVLTVDRDMGVMSIDNPHSAPVAMDSYAIQSAVGSIDGMSWNSLQDQGYDGNAWLETGSGGTANRLAELTMGGETFFPAMSSTPIGSVYSPHFTSFGVETEDYTFTYATLDGQIVDGIVNYIGDKQFNNLVLTVDPTTGDAQIRNESEFPVSIDGYYILSESGALLSGDSNWESLEDQGVEGGAWFEANVDATQVAELRDGGATFLDTNQGYNIGRLFDTEAERDLTFAFHTDGGLLAVAGHVVYGPLPEVNDPGQLLAGDYNGDGMVNAADYALWRDRLGAMATLPNDESPGMVTPSDYDQWRQNFGESGMGGVGANGVTAVPEPSTALLVGCCLLPLCRLIGKKEQER